MVHIKKYLKKKSFGSIFIVTKNILIIRPHVSFGPILTYVYIYTYILTFTSQIETHSHYICMNLYAKNVKKSENVCDREMRSKKAKS